MIHGDLPGKKPSYLSSNLAVFYATNDGIVVIMILNLNSKKRGHTFEQHGQKFAVMAYHSSRFTFHI